MDYYTLPWIARPGGWRNIDNLDIVAPRAVEISSLRRPKLIVIVYKIRRDTPINIVRVAVDTATFVTG